MKTNYQKVFEFNKTFGQDAFDVLQKNIFDEKPLIVKLRMDLIREEWEELVDAVNNKDMKETIDALADILYVVYGMGVTLGIDLDKAFSIVHDSNMSKTCNNDEDAEKTVEWYKNNQLAIYDTPAFRMAPDGVHRIIYNKSSGKILKSIYYKAADFSTLLD